MGVNSPLYKGIFFKIIKNSLSSVFKLPFLASAKVPSSNSNSLLSSDFKFPRPDLPLPTLK